MPTQTTDVPTSVLTALDPRQSLSQEDITAMLAEMRGALEGGAAMGFYERMELNHDARCCWWPGQTNDGRKWASEGRATPFVKHVPPGTKVTVFPWEGASDVRVPLVEEIINERVMMKRLALQRSQSRLGPRHLSPEDEPQQKAVLWGQVAEYYDDVARDSQRAATAQAADISEEYGHGVLHIGWQAEYQLAKRSLTAEQVLEAVIQQGMQMAEAQAQEAGRPVDEQTGSALAPAEVEQMRAAAAEQMGQMVLDPEARPMLAKLLMELDGEMPPSEAKRVAAGLKTGEPVEYYVPEVTMAQPEWTACTPFIDIFYPPTTTRLEHAAWIARTEWITEPELLSRVETHGYDAAWVEDVRKYKGQTFELSSLSECRKFGWILSHGQVRSSVRSGQASQREELPLYQILHVYYKSTALGGVPALYHTTLHGQVPDRAGHHECCAEAHGKYPFTQVLREQTAGCLLQSRGVGEISFTQQGEIKVQRDLRSDNASITISPPMRVPVNQAGGRVDMRPSAQIPTRQNGMGVFEPVRMGADPRGAQEVEATTKNALDAYWGRGPLVEPEVKLAMRQMLVSDFLADMRMAKVMTFQLIQQNAPETITASFVNGLTVPLHVSREEIQGQIALELDFDAADLDPSLVENRMKAIAALRTMDPQGLLQTAPLLKAMTAYLLPSHYRLLVADPGQHQKDEAEDEQRIAGNLLNGLESPYTPGQDHATRLQVLQGIFGVQLDPKGDIIAMQPAGKNGQPTRPQRLATEDADVGELVKNRLKFHAFQIQQFQNADTGKLGVEPVRMGMN